MKNDKNYQKCMKKINELEPIWEYYIKFINDGADIKNIFESIYTEGWVAGYEEGFIEKYR